ncbi:uncharacterized protein PAC_19244 [Phialocephala subalpina]|uniref:Nephrocystin 3-like N-terminal domain-containing protein n=1 Tax=Phialocephala subalpina TaxID=576137 RepID=A0A1L7XWC8_9HELO|nr:uncharacterized protein PAC_19244 [Phialocephala subalpina]
MESVAEPALAPEPSCQRTRVQVRDNDITVLYTPSAEAGPIVADIIFVHGLQGHPRKTWQAHADAATGKLSFFGLGKRKRGESGEASDAIFWPADLLPDDYTNLRILTYGYDSHVSHYFKGPANKLNLSQLGEGLLNRVVGERRRSKASGRAIVFVAHSLGGLLVKEALVESKKHGPDSPKIDVYKSTQGVVFFGTPHKGSNDAKWGLLLRSIASAAFDTNDKIIRTLEPDSELLDKLARDFQDIADEGKLKVCSLLESAGKTGLPIFNSKVVPDSSASFGSRKFEHQDYIEKNHMNMCRFVGKEDGGYSRFRDGLEFCVETQGGVLTEENTRQGLLRSLNYGEMLAREAQLVDANVNTLDWVWSLTTSPSSFSQWLSNGTGIFWIQGKPGSGKSTLMNYLKQHRRTRKFLTGAHCRHSIIIRFFFDFRARSGISNSFEGLLRSFLTQLTLEIPELSAHVAEFGHDPIAMLQPKTQQEFFWSTNNLRQALLSALRQCSTNILILIDGVDELEGTGRNMLDMVEFFQALASLDNVERRVKICIASRPHPLIVAAFNSSCGFKLQHQNDNGIKSYIHLRLKIVTQDPHSPSSFRSVLAQFGELIRKRSQGVFLWARFAVDEVLVGLAEGDEEEEIWARLQALPDELEEIYARIIKRTVLACGSSEETAIMLQIAYFTYRSLTLLEFFTVVQLSLGRPSLDDSFSCASFENRLRAKTGGLVEVVETKTTPHGEVKLIHETVRAYLNRRNRGSGVNLDYEAVGTPKEQIPAKDFDPHLLSSHNPGSQTIPSGRQNQEETPVNILDDLTPLGNMTWLTESFGSDHVWEESPQDGLLSSGIGIKLPALESSSDIDEIFSLNFSAGLFNDMGQGARGAETSIPSTTCVPSQVLQKRSKRRRPFITEARARTARTRKLHACINCKIYKTVCRTSDSDPGGRCLRRQASSPTIPRLPCLRSNITECQLNQYKCTVLDWADSLRPKERFEISRQIPSLDDKYAMTLALKTSYGPPLSIKMQALTLDDQVEDVRPEVVLLNTLGIESLEQATPAAASWIDECLDAYFEGTLDSIDQTARLCFQAAREGVKDTEASDNLYFHGLYTLLTAI